LICFENVAYIVSRFRWVALQLSELENCSNFKEIMVQLKDLPVGLDNTYNRILKMMNLKYHAHIMIFLQWLAFCQRPMSIAEIAEAITVDLDLKAGPVFNSTNRYADPRILLARCSSLVSESEGTVSLI